MTRRTLSIIAILAIPAIAVAWWLGSPLFLDRAVDEDFPRTVRATIPDSMTQGQVEAVMAGLAERVDETAEPMPGSTSVTALRRGEFEDADRLHRGSGSATIYRLANGDDVLRFEDFRVTNGQICASCSRGIRLQRVVLIWRAQGMWSWVGSRETSGTRTMQCHRTSNSGNSGVWSSIAAPST